MNAPEEADAIEEWTPLDEMEAYTNRKIFTLDSEIRELNKMLQERIRFRSELISFRQRIKDTAHAQRIYDASTPTDMSQ